MAKLVALCILVEHLATSRVDISAKARRIKSNAFLILDKVTFRE
jgi:hypothetical protein